MSLKTRINKVEKDLNVKQSIQSPIDCIALCCNPTEEDEETVRKIAAGFDPYVSSLIVYSKWESRSTVICLLRIRRGDLSGELFEGFELEWDYKQGIGFGDNQIIKFVGEFPEGNEFEKDSQIQIMSKGRQKRYSSED